MTLITEEFKGYVSFYKKSFKSIIGKKNVFRNVESILTLTDTAGTTDTKIPKILIRHQIAFLFDITGSMQPYINTSREQISKFIEELKKDAENELLHEFGSNAKFELVFEVSILGYRDFSDANHFEVLDFTTDISSVVLFLNELIASGGDDYPEDVKGAFIHALFGINETSHRLSWKDDSTFKALIWLSDAPPHGKSFHDLISYQDNYFHDINEEWNTIFSRIAIDNIAVYVMKITNDTSRACELLNKIATSSKVNFTIVDITQMMSEKQEKIIEHCLFSPVSASVSAERFDLLIENDDIIADISSLSLPMLARQVTSAIRYSSSTTYKERSQDMNTNLSTSTIKL